MLLRSTTGLTRAIGALFLEEEAVDDGAVALRHRIFVNGADEVVVTSSKHSVSLKLVKQYWRGIGSIK
jgi:hypothetical protein